MTTDPGDLVIDPTCGSGTTAFCAELWGRRWITVDTSRVPLALARQRLLTAKYPYYELVSQEMGPAGGFVYRRKTSPTGDEVGGIVPHITMGTIANNEEPKYEVVRDRPELNTKITRVTGPFVFEATIPTAFEEQPGDDRSDVATHENRMFEILKQSPILRLPSNKQMTLTDIRKPTKTLVLSAEAAIDGNRENRTAILFGPENGAISHKAVFSAIQEAHLKGYKHLIAIGFAIEPNARTAIEQCEEVIGIPGIYVQATPDVSMSDLLKTSRSSQIFSVCGLPEIEVSKHDGRNGALTYSVSLKGLDTFDPMSMESIHRNAEDVPAWFLDTDYNGLVFHVDQAFFPKTGAWENLKKSLGDVYQDQIWGHLSGTKSALFEPGENKQIAVKVIDERGNELIVTKPLEEAKR